jgi:homoserine dehydrogenase
MAPRQPARRTLDLVLVGFGHVAQRFVTLVEEQRACLARDCGVDPRIVGIMTLRHGCARSARGLDAAALATKAADGEAIGPARGGSSADFIRQIASKSAAAADGRLVIVETTTLDIAAGQPAIDHVRAALDCGAHVITANKGPAAFAYRDLAAAAARARRRFLFEGAVMDGIPIFNLVRETLPCVEVIGFRGVVNSTTNYILTAMESGQSFRDALAEMQAMGVAEADASLDVDGWDAAAKTSALANVLLGASLTPHTVEREGISAATGLRAVAARKSGRRLKLVARAGRADGAVSARVAPEELAEDDLLAGLEGQQNALVLHTDQLGEVAIVQRGAGLTATAYALVSDLVAIGRGLRAADGARPALRRARRDRSRARRGRR